MKREFEGKTLLQQSCLLNSELCKAKRDTKKREAQTSPPAQFCASKTAHASRCERARSASEAAPRQRKKKAREAQTRLPRATAQKKAREAQKKIYPNQTKQTGLMRRRVAKQPKTGWARYYTCLQARSGAVMVAPALAAMTQQMAIH